MKKRHSVPHVLHALQVLVMVVATGGLDMAAGGLETIVVVVVVVVLDHGNRTHIKSGLFALEGAKHPIVSFLDLLFLWDLLGFSLFHFVGECFLVYCFEAQATGEKGLFAPLCFSMNASIFLQSKGKGFTCLLQEL